ncbi:MAG: hypothetical protein JST82_01470 [Bacteroidetes bacterium]|nr:hypothetical protein [Bacteroidota bacterium]
MASFTTEDIFVREMILHGKPERAIKEAFPRLIEEYTADAIAYMMDNPEVRHRIDAGIVYFYRDYVNGIRVPEIAPVTLEERKELLLKIIRRERKNPKYILTKDGLGMIMVKPELDEVNEALKVYYELQKVMNKVVR